MNGTYHPTDEIYNGRVLFRKGGVGDTWLRYVSDQARRYWMVSSTTNKDANDINGLAHCNETGLYDPAEAAGWTVYDGGEWGAQPAVTCIHQPPPPCIIAGATGQDAATVNGTYHPTDEIYNGRVLFRKGGGGGQWLRYLTDQDRNYWMVSPTANKDANDDIGWAHCIETGLYDPAKAATWTVYDGGEWGAQPAVTCIHQPPPPCIIAGATGQDAATVNGTYHPTDEIYNGRVLFRKGGGGGQWLRYLTDQDRNYWMVSPTANKDANDDIGWAHCIETGLYDPAKAATWTVYDGGEWGAQPAVTCVHRWAV